MKKLFACSASMLLTAGVGAPAMAQTEPALELEEVVVTAEKRAENLQQVSLSIQVKDGEDLRKSGKKRIDEIMEGTVGIQAQGSPTGTSFYIRGVEPANAGRGTPVTTPIIIDGVAQNRTETVRGGTLDVAQVEVMRGPQSTALGANSLSGAISLVTNKPVFEYQGTGTLEVGNYHKQSVEGVLNVPLTDNQALRFAYATDRRDGYYSNGSGETDLLNARVKYRLQFSDDLDTVFTFSHQKIGGNGSELGVLSSGHWEPYTDTTTALSCASSPTSGDYLGCPVRYVSVADGTNFRTRSDAWSDGLPPQGWGWTAYQNTTVDQANVEIDWNTALGAVVIQPSFQRSHTFTQEGAMGLTSAMGVGYAIEDIRENSATLDARISSNPGSLVKWQAGVRYNLDDYGTNNLFVNVSAPGSSPDCNGNAWCYTYSVTPDQKAEGLSGYANGEFSIVDNLRVIGGLRYNRDKASVTEVNGTVLPFGAIHGTPNGYYQNELDAAVQAGECLPSAMGVCLKKGSQTWTKSTYRFGFEWDVLPEAMVYATYSTGYTPGSVGGMSFDMGTLQYVPNSATTLKQIAAGFKSQWLDNRLQYNAEFFHTKYFNRTAPISGVSTSLASTCSYLSGSTTGNGVQVVNAGSGACAQISNTVQAPEVLSSGIDMDLTWLLSAADRLVVTAEWLDTQYNKRPIVLGGYDYSSQAAIEANINAADTGDIITPAQEAELAANLNDALSALVGAQLQNAPKYSATLAYSHEFDFGSGGQLTPRIEATYKDKYWSQGELGMGGATLTQVLADTSSSNLNWQQSYVKWDANLNWTKADGKFDVNAYVKNIRNEVIMTALSSGVVQLAAPRTFGVTVSANF